MQTHLFPLLMVLLLFTYGQNHSDEEKWELRMVNNVRWDLSKSYLAVHTEEANGKEHLGEEVMPGYEGAKMSFFYGLGFNNMLIDFKTHEDTGAAYCKIGVIPDEILMDIESAFNATSEYKENHCSFERKLIYKNDIERYNNMKRKKYSAFCAIKPKGELLIKWIVANGTFNRPAKAPQCLHDFHTAARAESFEYELFRYCAKGYFFNGKNYDESANFSNFRKDWLLYLAEGKVTCGISGNTEEDNRLLAKGYTVELVHRFDFEQFNAHHGMIECPLSAILTSYNDRDPGGKFFFAAVVGAGQLDGHFQVSDRPEDKRRFWSEESYKEEYKTMTLGERGCYLHYHNWNRMPKSNRYYLELRVTHYCTGRAMRETISFDVSTGRDSALEGFHEDRGIVIDLATKTLRRTTGQVLCAKETPAVSTEPMSIAVPHQQPHCVQPPRQTLEHKQWGHVCDQEQTQCRMGSKCTTGDGASSACNSNVTCTQRDMLECGACVCREIHQNTNCDNDWQCAEHMFCANANECKKMHYKESGEPCWSHSECFPGFGCYRETTGTETYGICSSGKQHNNKPYKCPRSKLQSNPCQVFKCPKEQKWSDCGLPSDTAQGLGCVKKTYDDERNDGFPGGLEACDKWTFKTRYRCCL